MGSSSFSTSSSSTEYINTPLTLNDANSGAAVAGNQNAIGNSSLINGANYGAVSILDGEAIKRAFDTTDKSVAAIMDLTAKIISNQTEANTAALQFTEKANAAAVAASNPDATAQKQTNYTLMVFGGLVALYLFTKGKK